MWLVRTVLAIAIAATFQDRSYYPYIVIESGGELRATFLHRGRQDRDRCDADVAKYVAAIKGITEEALTRIARREIETFHARIGQIGSVDELVKDHQVYSFVMKAFGLEKEIFAKAMMKRILTADPTARSGSPRAAPSTPTTARSRRPARGS